ncbi:MAG: hypothetical protein IPL60_04010 [Ardenticatenia bacterium]|nr:hypothetical protein [Ardenticatenia bacterium]
MSSASHSRVLISHQDHHKQVQAPLDTRITGLKRYIDRMRADGVADEIIHDHLRRAGWSEQELTQAGGG